MSLNRLMLRALAINALSPQPGDGDQITFAGDRVFDSRLDPAQFSEDENEIPLVIVYTDEDMTQLVNRSTNTGPFARHVDLRIEIVIGSFDTVVQDDDKFAAFGVPTTDGELEAKLDMFEQQVRWALYGWPTRRATNAFREYVVAFADIMSHVERDESGNNRLAMRRLIVRCKIHDDCPPGWGLKDTGMQTQLPLFREDDFGKLPPWLRPMLVASQSSPSMRQVVNVLSGTNNPAVLVPLLKRISATTYPVAALTDAELENFKRQRPLGRPKVLSIWRL